MILIADVLLKLLSPKKVIKWMPIKSNFRRVFHNKHGKRSQRLLKSAQRDLYDICPSLWKYSSWKKSMLVLCNFLRLFVKTLTDDEKYCLLYRENLTEPIHILLSQKQKTFCQFFSAFLKATFNFEHFRKKDDLHSRYISQTTVPEIGD